MNQQILSQDEVDALLQGITGESQKLEAEEQQTEGIRAYDLSSQERIVRGRMPTMEVINERFARNSYALLTVMIAQASGLTLGDFVHSFGDVHLYNNHVEQAREQLSRTPREFPRMRLNPERTNLFDFRFEDFTLEGYDPHPAIKAPVAV